MGVWTVQTPLGKRLTLGVSDWCFTICCYWLFCVIQKHWREKRNAKRWEICGFLVYFGSGLWRHGIHDNKWHWYILNSDSAITRAFSWPRIWISIDHWVDCRSSLCSWRLLDPRNLYNRQQTRLLILPIELPHSVVKSSLSSSPLSASITSSLFHFRLKTHLFNASFPPTCNNEADIYLFADDAKLCRHIAHESIGLWATANSIK